MRDIGYHFSDTDPRFKGIDSKVLLKEVMRLLRAEGFELGNIDSTICLQAPKVNPYIPEMKRCLADVMGVAENLLSIKATTSEKLGFVGKEEGITAYCVALINQSR